VLFGKKVFVSGVATEGSTGKGGLFAPARPIIPSYNSLIALDLGMIFVDNSTDSISCREYEMGI